MIVFTSIIISMLIALLIAILLVVVFTILTFARSRRLHTNKELVWEVNSPNELATIEIYQLGKDIDIWFSTPMEIRCTNAQGVDTLSTPLKDGHMIKEYKESSVTVIWNEGETGGEIQLPKNGSISFYCKKD